MTVWDGGRKRGRGGLSQCLPPPCVSRSPSAKCWFRFRVCLGYFLESCFVDNRTWNWFTIITVLFCCYSLVSSTVSTYFTCLFLYLTGTLKGSFTETMPLVYDYFSPLSIPHSDTNMEGVQLKVSNNICVCVNSLSEIRERRKGSATV